MASPANRDRSPRTGQAGFTLMELIVSCLLISVVLGGVYTAFSTALLTFRTGEAGMRNYQGARIAATVLSQELQCVIPGSAHLFEGENDEVTFFSVVQPMEVKKGEHARVLRIRYRTKEDPESRDKILVREEEAVKGPLPMPEKGEEDQDSVDSDTLKLENKETFEVASGIKDFELSYYWIRPKKQGQDAQEVAPQDYLILDENRKGWGLPQGLKFVLTVSDPNAEKGKTVFTTFVGFQGPTTPFEKGGAAKEGEMEQ